MTEPEGVTHPGITMIAELIESSGLRSATILEQRELMGAAAAGSPAPEGVTVEPTELGGRPAEWLRPHGAPADRAVLYLHGGGYCIGSLGTHRGLAGRLALAADRSVASLDYRLAPEHPFPAAIDDALAAYRQLLDEGYASERLAIGGDSAGGGLTLATLVAARDEGLPLPAAAFALSPWVDLTQTAGSYERFAGLDPMVTKAGLDTMAAAYLGDRDATRPLASPLFADLAGLPPVHVEVGAVEALVDDSTRLVDALRAAGGKATLTVWPGLVHVFQAFPGDLVPEADESVAAVGAWLAAHLS